MSSYPLPHSNEDEVSSDEKKIIEGVTGAGYSISTGYAIRGRDEDIDGVIKRSDDIMYKSKADYYRSMGTDQRVDHYQVKDGE